MHRFTFDKLGKNKNFFLFSITLFFLAVIVFISGYWRMGSIGLFGDDWGASTYIFNPTLKQAVLEWWHVGSGEVGNFRLLAVVLPVFWYGIFSLFGLTGVIVFNYTCFVLLAYLLYLILSKHVSRGAAFAGALLFALYPTNNAYLWQVTMSYSLALAAMFGAILSHYRGKYLVTLCLLSVSILLNEGVFFVFVVALLLPKSGTWEEVKAGIRPWFKAIVPVLVLYAGTRVTLEVLGLTGDDRAVKSLYNFHVISYIRQFITGEAVVLVISFAVMVWKIFHAFAWRDLAVGLFSAGVAWYAIRSLSQSGEVDAKRTRPLYFALLGLAAVCAGRYYGFYYVPSINVLNLDSRYYFAASVGGVVFFAAVMEWFLHRFGPKMFTILFSMIIVVLSIARFEVQRDYAAGSRESSLIWREIFTAIPAPADPLVIVIDIPGRELGKPVGLFEAMGDLRILMPRLYNSSITAVSSPYIQNLTISETEVCIDSAPFYRHACFPIKDYIRLRWENSKLTLVTGNPELLTQGPGSQRIPDSFRQVLHLRP